MHSELDEVFEKLDQVLYQSLPRQCGATTFLIELANKTVAEGKHVAYFVGKTYVARDLFHSHGLSRSVTCDSINSVMERLSGQSLDLIIFDNAYWHRVYTKYEIQYLNSLMGELTFFQPNAKIIWLETR